MSKSKKTTKVATFIGWGNPESDGFVEAVPNPGPDMEVALTSAGPVGWTNTFTNASKGDRVILRVGAPASARHGRWVLTGRA